jgi:tetratricopeptide (TPR) repeat protein
MAENWVNCPHCSVLFWNPESDPRTDCPACKQPLVLTAQDPSELDWYYIENKKKVGPVKGHRLQELAASGALKPTDMVLENSTTKWMPAAEVAGLFPSDDPANAPLMALPIDTTSADVPTPVSEATFSEPPTDAPQWYYKEENQQKVGPVALAQLRELVAAGRMRRGYMLQPKGKDTWVPAGMIEGLFDTRPVPVPVIESIAPAQSPVAIVQQPPEPAPATEKPGWHYIKNSQKVGPVSLERLIELLEYGQLQPDDLVLAHGSSKWVPIHSIGADSPTSEAPIPVATEPAASPPQPIEAPPAVPAPVAIEPPPMTASPEPAAALPEPTPSVAAPITPEPALQAVAVATAVATAESPNTAPREQPAPPAAALFKQPARWAPPGKAPAPEVTAARLAVAPKPEYSPEETVRRFESAWWQGKHPELEDYLPSNLESRRTVLPEMTRIDLRCKLNCRETVRAEQYLERYPELADNRPAVLELLALEYELRRREQPGLPVKEYLDRFPQYSVELSGRLQALAAPPTPAATAKPEPEPAQKIEAPAEPAVAAAPPVAPAEAPPTPTSTDAPAIPGSAQPAGLAERVLQFAKSDPYMAAILVGLPLVAFIIIAGIYWKYRDAQRQKILADSAVAQASERGRDALKIAEDASKALKQAQQEAAAARAKEKLALENEKKAREAEKQARAGEQKALENEKKAQEELSKGRAGLEQTVQAWHRQHADHWEKAGQPVAAAYHLGRLIELNPLDEKLLVRRAEAYGKHGQWLLAFADYSRALEMKPDLPVKGERDHCLVRCLPARAATAVGFAFAEPLTMAASLQDLPPAPSK